MRWRNSQRRSIRTAHGRSASSGHPRLLRIFRAAGQLSRVLEAARIYNEPKYRAVAEKGGEFILLAQMPDPQPAWAQQYDREMHPAWARAFEPPAVTGGESQGIMKTLLVLFQETGNRKYLDA